MGSQLDRTLILALTGSSEVKASASNVGNSGLIPGSGRGEGNGNPLQYSCLENPMDRGVWQATVHGVAKSRTRLSNFTSLSLARIFMSFNPLFHLLLFWVSSLPFSKHRLSPYTILLPTYFPKYFSSFSLLSAGSSYQILATWPCVSHMA